MFKSTNQITQIGTVSETVEREMPWGHHMSKVRDQRSPAHTYNYLQQSALTTNKKLLIIVKINRVLVW